MRTGLKTSESQTYGCQYAYNVMLLYTAAKYQRTLRFMHAQFKHDSMLLTKYSLSAVHYFRYLFVIFTSLVFNPAFPVLLFGIIDRSERML